MWGGKRMNDIIKILKSSRLFCDLSQECIRQKLLPQGMVKEYFRHASVIAPQDYIDWFGIVLEGRIRIVQMFSDGISSLMGNLGPAYMLGADLICTKSRRSPYHAIADTQVKIFILPGNVLLEPGRLSEPERSQVGQRLLTLLSHENMRKHYRLAVLSRHGLRDRILVYLTMQAEQKETRSFYIPFSRDEMADFLCVNRSALSHELSKMAKEGLIRFHKNHFTLLKSGWDQSLWDFE